jgi:hypothetical protein
MFDNTPWIKHWIFKKLLSAPTNDNAEYSDLHLFQSEFRIWERYVGVGLRHTGTLLVFFSFCQWISVADISDNVSHI